MENEMIERVAKAIYQTFENRPLYAQAQMNDLLAGELARAAIEAMREPTPEMVRQTIDFMFTVSLGGEYRWPHYARDVHCCMIDAALAEPLQANDADATTYEPNGNSRPAT